MMKFRLNIMLDNDYIDHQNVFNATLFGALGVVGLGMVNKVKIGTIENEVYELKINFSTFDVDEAVGILQTVYEDCDIPITVSLFELIDGAKNPVALMTDNRFYRSIDGEFIECSEKADEGFYGWTNTQKTFAVLQQLHHNDEIVLEKWENILAYLFNVIVGEADGSLTISELVEFIDDNEITSLVDAITGMEKGVASISNIH